MLALLKKRVQETEPAVPPNMEGTESSASLQNPSPSPLEVPEESIPREQSLENPRTESLDTEMILQHLRESQAGQDSLLSEMAELKTSINQMNRWLKEAESRFSSLEARAHENQQTNSITTASQSEPTAGSAAASPSFGSQQMMLDAAQAAAPPTSASAYPRGTSSEQFRTTSSNLMYSETEENAYQMLAAAWYQDTNFESETAGIESEETGIQVDASSRPSPLTALTSTEERALPAIAAVCSLERISGSETAYIKAEESDQQEETFSRALPSLVPEYETDIQPLLSAEEAAPPIIAAIGSLGSFCDSETAHIKAEESYNQEEIFSRAMPSLVPEYETDPQPLLSLEEAAPPIMAAIGSQERIAEREEAHIEPEESDHQENNVSGGSHQQQPLTNTLLETPQLTALAAASKEAPDRATQSSGRRSANKRSRRTALTSIPNQRRRTSIVWQYFKSQTKFKATCMICGMNVQTGKEGVNVGTSALLTHLKRNHEITRGKVVPSVSPEAGSKSQDAERPSTTKKSNGTKSRWSSLVWLYFKSQSSNCATCIKCNEDVQLRKTGECSKGGAAALLSHLQCKHGILQEEEAPSALPGGGSETQDAGRPSTTERPRRTTSVASTCTVTSLVTLSCLPSPPPGEVRPATKRRCRRRASIAWQHFTKRSEFKAISGICEEGVQTGQRGGHSSGGTATLLRHLKREDGIPQELAAPSVLPGAGSEIQSAERPSTSKRSIGPKRRRRSIVWKFFTSQSMFMATCNLCKEVVRIGKRGGCGSLGTGVLLSHLKRKHGCSQGKVAPPVLPEAGSTSRDAERPSATEKSSRIKRRRTSAAWQHFTRQSEFMATCNLCKKDVQMGNIGGCRNRGTTPLLRHLKREHGNLQEKATPTVFPGVGPEAQDVERPSTSETPGRIASSSCTATSPAILSCLSSSPIAAVRPPTKCRRTSVAWRFFTSQSKYMATCELCKEVVQTGKIGGCGNVGTSALLSHLRRKHGNILNKAAPSMLPRAGSEIQDAERPSTSAASTAALPDSEQLAVNDRSAHLRATFLELIAEETPLPSTSLPLAIATDTQPDLDSLDFHPTREEPGFYIEAAIQQHFPNFLRPSDVEPFSQYLEDHEYGPPDLPVQCPVQNPTSKFAITASNNGCVFKDTDKLLDLVEDAD